MSYTSPCASWVTRILFLASSIFLSQSTLATEGLKHRVQNLEAQIVEISSVLADYEARLAALEDGGPEEPPNEEWACGLWSEQDMLTFNTPWRDDLYLPSTQEGLTIYSGRSEYASLEAYWTIAYETFHKETGDIWTVFNVLSVSKRTDTGELWGLAFKGARPGGINTAGPWNDYLDPNFNDQDIPISRSDFINCAETLYSGILPNDDIMYEPRNIIIDGLDPRSADWDWEEALDN